MSIKAKINDTRERIDSQKNRVLETITERREDITARSRKLRDDLDRRRDMAVGKLREEGLERIYDVGEQALLTAANLVARAQELTPKRLSVLEGHADKLRGQAEKIELAKDELHKPAVVNYDNLNVSEVNLALAGLSYYQLLKVRAYEANHKNRVTIIREIDRLTGEAAN